MFDRTALPIGPRVITARVPGARSISVTAHVLAGSRLEGPTQTGVAHFMEHLTFKGTKSYPTTRALSEAIEGVGGSFNAATDRETTVYWARVPARHADLAIDVLGELITRPKLDPRDIDNERNVIVEEIRSYLDDPAEHAHLLFDRAMFGDGPLGREIAGDEASVRGVAEAAIHSFWSDCYRPAHTVVAIAGDLPHEAATARISAAFGTGDGALPGFEAAPALPAGERIVSADRDTTQAQVCLGVPGLPRDHPDSWGLEVLNAILGDGMSSRLFLGVREERGLAYDVHSFLVDYRDAGALVVYAGADPDKLVAAVRAIVGELAALRDRRVPEAEIAKAQAYLSGRLELKMDDTRFVSSWFGGQEALHARVLTADDALAAIAAVDAAQVQRLAGELIRNDHLRLAVVAPPGHLRGLDRALRIRGES